jgi:TRAP-type uncharacterized transport system fused permease subunit
MIEDLKHENDEADIAEAQRIAEEAEGGSRHVERGVGKWIVPGLAAVWSIFQLLLPSAILLDSTIVRSIHLTFAIVLVFLTHPMIKKPGKGKIGAISGREGPHHAARLGFGHCCRSRRFLYRLRAHHDAGVSGLRRN